MPSDSDSGTAASPPFAASPSTIPAAISARIALLLIAIVATAVVAPMFFLGNASGHDISFHLASWLDVAGQWREGVAYPRWAEWANWGFGEPRFIFYPPASWTLGAALGSVLPWRMVPGAFIWLALVLSGVSMWRLARESLPGMQAVAAALIFMVNPYQLMVVYYRSDFAELLATALFPLLLLGILRVVRDRSRQGSRSIPLVAIVFAGIWLANAPAAVIATYSVALLLAAGSLEQRSIRPLIFGGAAMALGFGLAAFYILPAAFEQRWVQIAQVVEGNLHLDQNFLFTHSNDPEFALFNWKVSSAALGTILMAGIAAVFSARRRREYPAIWWMLVALGSASAFMMFPASIWLWRYLPKLQFLQFPWRWLAPLGIPYAFFLASAISQWRWRWVGYCGLAIVIAGAATAIVRDAWWDSEDIPILAAAIRTGHGYEGTDEYAPLGCDRYNLPGAILDPDSPEIFTRQPPTPPVERFDPASDTVVSLGDGDAQISIGRWNAEAKDFRVESAAPVTLALRLVNYPAWRIRVDGAIAEAASQPETARMLLQVPAGRHDVDIRFRRTPDRTAGAAISGLAALLLLASTILASRLRRLAP